METLLGEGKDITRHIKKPRVATHRVENSTVEIAIVTYAHPCSFSRKQVIHFFARFLCPDHFFISEALTDL